MCRMFAYVGTSRIELERLFASLKRSAENDTIASRFTDRNVHGDGWGFVIRTENKTFLYKSDKPVFEDAVALPELDGIGSVYAVFHAKNVLFESLRGRFSQPECVETASEQIFVCWNGSLQIENTDTAIKIRTGLNFNLLALSIDRASGGASVRYLNSFNTKNPDKQEYFRLYTKEFGNGLSVMSSTLAHHGIGGEHAKYGELVELKSDAAVRI